jgi:oligosaccharide repeat unit polymerase
MFLVITVLLMAGLTAMNYRVSRSVLYPPALLAATWTLLLGLLLATGDLYYPISPPTMIVYLAGVIAFSVGAFLSTHFFAQSVRIATPRLSRRPGGLILTGGLILLVAVLPLYWDHIQDFAAAAASEDFWRSVRVETVAQGDDWSIKTFVTLLWEACSVLAVLLAVTAVAENNGSRFSRSRMFGLIAIALIYGLMAGGSSGAVSLALGVIGIDAVRHGGLRTRTIIVGLTVAIVSFAVVAAVLSKGNIESSASISENVSGTIELVGVYLLGGVVAFDAVVQYPASITPVWSMWRVFQLTANKFGSSFDVPSIHAEYTDISNDYNGNVYTMYFSYYPDYGLVGVCVIMVILGALVTVIYQKAVHGNPRAVVLYAFVFSGIVLSGFSEYFFLGANFWFKAILYTMLAYRFLPTSVASQNLLDNPAHQRDRRGAQAADFPSSGPGNPAGRDRSRRGT